MTSRRQLLAGLFAAGLAPSVTWADAGAPDYLSAARDGSGAYLMAGLNARGDVLFRHPLPGRGHAGAAHPNRPEGVAFARRPGRFAHVIDCRSGATIAQLSPPEGHHFYGHGVFSEDGRVLYTTENEYETARGMIGLWDGRTYQRIGQFASQGVGPHEILRHPAGLVVANGGIETHPDSGRAKLNIATMRPNLSYLSLEGDLLEQLELAPDLHRNSIRHLSLAPGGTVGFAMQWEGARGADVPIVALHDMGGPARFLGDDDPRLRNLNGYGGSIAFASDGAEIAVTSPRGGVLQVLDCTTGAIRAEHRAQDICGLAARARGFVVTTGQGLVADTGTAPLRALQQHDLAWDNHMVALG